jgi:hypothetical protein
MRLGDNLMVIDKTKVQRKFAVVPNHIATLDEGIWFTDLISDAPKVKLVTIENSDFEIVATNVNFKDSVLRKTLDNTIGQARLTFHRKGFIFNSQKPIKTNEHVEENVEGKSISNPLFLMVYRGFKYDSDTLLITSCGVSIAKIYFLDNAVITIDGQDHTFGKNSSIYRS